ncbi:indolepyruvate ferredoxin oxidoreductase family protein [Aquabacterium fontiphilum]|jgi:indolepyruvate ferredoxin oxidoreductase|uniref:indolepyruvate ferredoxin oxidoreductase family protein n=1 Tax=Aquabacterium fontiphilum TaxID=450365 RepID=UPI001377F1A3|nr:indolepyruvate ferredoxin oxidoreductase family protein [Aquabacterium fontiphilum]NBD19929.1 indolepyruvate ferredoxin oxidoreductase family protein [Aquabacterium fontiphilum]
MNAPLPADVLKALATVSLDDKYTLERGLAFMSGVQALVRLPMLQRTRDAMAGLNTAGFISGYRGSPLGGYDHALWQAKAHLQAQHIVFQPGVNEELGATAVWGSQQLRLTPGPHRFDGVFGLWYAKGPGVDRSADVLKHANMAGTAPHGGVIAVAGDDHAAKSSSLAHQSDHIFKACGLPVFFPASVQEILDLGLHAYAMSRYAGLWAGMKTIQEVVESASTVCVDPDRVQIVLPDQTEFELPEGGLHIRWPDTPLAQEARLMDHKWYAALAYIRANRLNHTVIDSPDARLGIIASGKAYNDLRQALHDLGLDDEACRRIGLRVHKVGVVWPLEASITRAFATGLQEILVVEEKRQMIEYQLKEELYNWREDVRPNVLGKFTEPDGDFTGGEWSMANPVRNTLLRAKADLTPALIAKAVAQRMARLGLLERVDSDLRAHVAERLRVIEAKEHALARSGADAERAPWFCSGCPHNTSTTLPEGSRALAGIGCHYMAQWMDRNTGMVCQMGGEGVTWVGQAPFTDEPHVFVNLGDGTYFHSGILAVRQAIAAGVNITYKILYNDAVAMTGGQPIDGNLSVAAMTRELHAEGARRIVVVSDAPEKYGAVDDLAPGVTVFHRDRLDEVQQMLRATAGCTALIYDQTCATEKRRRRKRGKLPQATARVVINELVCEGCGDCAVQSNCLSVETVETPLGRKRRINQSSCNQDLSCVKGFCPSLVTIEGGRLKAPTPQAGAPRIDSLGELPHPALPACDQAYGIVVAGIGGTGVITIGQLLGMAAHIEGKGVVTQEAAGLAQKGGATWSHIQIAEQPDAIRTTKVGVAEADLVLGCDPIVAAHGNTLAVMHASRTRVALNTHQTPTAALVKDRDWRFPSGECEQVLAEQVGRERIRRMDAARLAEQVLGDAIYANPMMLGFAWQMGWVPLALASIHKAIELNGVKVGQNLAAFTWGRWAAHDPVQVARLTVPAQPVQWAGRGPKPSGQGSGEELDAMVARRVAYLREYQDEAYAQHYADWVARVRQAEAPLGGERLTREVARNLFKLMAIKDEYEVARLLTAPSFREQVAVQFEGEWKMVFHFAPPAFSGALAWLTGRPSQVAGRPAKHRFGPWAQPLMRWLAKGRRIRGTWLDLLALTADRREDRAVWQEYEMLLTRLLPHLTRGNLALACRMAAVPDGIRGYGPVRHAAIASARAQWQTLWQQAFHGPLEE